jgi:hypothetical protein
MRNALVTAAALAAGAAIAWIDSRPTWDDTGVTAAMLLVASGVFGFASPRLAWVWALAVGAWIPLVAMTHHQRPWSLLVLGFTFAGAYIGWGIRKALSPEKR